VVIGGYAVVIASAVLWGAGLRLFLRAGLPPARKIRWVILLVVTGAAIGVLLPRDQVWQKFLILLAALPLLGAADVLLLRSGRPLSFWVRACGFELVTVFGVAGLIRVSCDAMGLAALVGRGA